MELSAPFEPPESAAPRVKALFDYWRSIHPGGGLLPGRGNLDPVDIPQLLPNIWMIDVTRDPLRFRFRLVGTEIVSFTGRDVTGRWLDEFYTDYETTEAFRRHRDCAMSGVPAYYKGTVLSNPGRNYVEAERLYLPLAENGEDVDILLIMTLYHGNPPRRR